MIKFEISETELNNLVKVAGKLSGESELDKLNNFRLHDDNRISFDQAQLLSTTPSVKLSADSSGKLVIDINRLAENRIGKLFLMPFEGFVTKQIADKTKGILQRESRSQLSLNLTNVLPLNAQVKKAAIQNKKLFLELEV